MKRPFFIVILVLLVLGLISACVWFRRELTIDSCLDRSGRWNDEIAACEGATE